MTKKIIGLMGSPRKLGNSHVLLEICLAAAGSRGAETEIIYLHELSIKQCRGCLACVYKGRCAIEDDDMPDLLTKLLEADGLVVAAPTYIFSPSGLIKTLVDRCLMLSPHLEKLTGKTKYAATISVAGNVQWNPLGPALLKQLALAYGFQIADGIEAYAPGPAETLLQEDILAGVRKMGERMADIVSAAGNLSETKNASVCPVCGSNVFAVNGLKVQCAACLAEGEFDGAPPQITFPIQEHNFFFIPDRIEHVEDWIKPSRPNFMNKLPAIKEKLLQLGLKKPKQEG